jgi:hypothetical protein
MIKKRIERLLALEPENSCAEKYIILDNCGFAKYYDYAALLREHGYNVYEYTNVEAFRVLYEENLKLSAERIAVVVAGEYYVPYDIQRAFRKINLSLAAIFPFLNSDAIGRHIRDLDLISFAYDSCYSDISTEAQTEDFIRDIVFARAMVERFCQSKTEELRTMCDAASKYSDWFDAAKLKAVIGYYATMENISIDLSFADAAFMRFISDGYGSLSTQVNRDYPPIVAKTLGVISGRGNGNEKAALIVMDGMSLFDFEIISRYFDGIEFEYHCSFALIPTTTSISRQSLLSGKYPRELEKPFSLAGEEKEFIAASEQLGYAANQIQYVRGFEPDISPRAKFVAVIINEVDDIVHGQRQERVGMLGDMNVLGRSGKLQRLISSLVKLGFTVYISADHGNTPCVGVGGFRSGVETETRSMRMAVLKNFAEANALLSQNAGEYQGYYLNKNYRYFICNPGVSFDSKGESVMTHGGISLDEVIVPFIKVKEF